MVTVTVRSPTEYRGCQIIHLYETDQVKRAVVSYNDTEKAYFEDGRFAVDLLVNSWKYGSEFQLIYHTRLEPQIMDRIKEHNGHFRIELCFTPEEGKRLVRALRE